MYFVMLMKTWSGAIPRGFVVEHGEFADAWVKCVRSWSCMHTLGDQLLVALNSQVVLDSPSIAMFYGAKGGFISEKCRISP